MHGPWGAPGVAGSRSCCCGLGGLSGLPHRGTWGAVAPVWQGEGVCMGVGVVCQFSLLEDWGVIG